MQFSELLAEDVKHRISYLELEIKSKTKKFDNLKYKDINEFPLLMMDDKFVLIVDKLINDIPFRGGSFESIQLFKYGKYYIILEFSLDGNGDDKFQTIENVLDDYENIFDMLDSNSTIIPESEFDADRFVKDNLIKSFDSILQFYRNFYTDRSVGKIHFHNFMNLQFDGK